jgi:hypothetical protein
MKPKSFQSTIIGIIFFGCLMHPPSLHARELTFSPIDSTKERNVDYLEKIYFSGENNEGLLNAIQITLQNLQQQYTGKNIPTAVGSQVNFLGGVYEKAQNAKDACEITDMLAAGIYNLDVSEAVAQGIPRPKEKVSADLGTLISASQNIAETSAEASWDALYLTGSLKGFSTLSKISQGASITGKAGETLNTANSIRNTFFKPKDKGCKSVPQKVITIGEHQASQQNSVAAQAIPKETQPGVSSDNTGVTSDKKTIITIIGIDYEKLTALEQNIKACSTVKSTVKKFNTSQSTIEVTHTGTTDELLSLMLQTCKSNLKSSNITKTEDGAVALKL